MLLRSHDLGGSGKLSTRSLREGARLVLSLGGEKVKKEGLSWTRHKSSLPSVAALDLSNSSSEGVSYSRQVPFSGVGTCLDLRPTISPCGLG